MDNPTPTKFALISRRAREDSGFQFTSLAHLLNAEFLRGCYWILGKEKASGIDGRSWHDYGEHLDENLVNLVERLKAKKYKPLPGNVIWSVMLTILSAWFNIDRALMRLKGCFENDLRNSD